MSSLLLSILIPTVPSRLHTVYPKLIDSLMEQTSKRSDVEVIGLFDNKKRSLGEKRNDLMRLANGAYLAFVDDDDSVADDYVEQICTALENHPNADLVVFDVLLHQRGRGDVRCYYDMNITRRRNKDAQHYEGHPAHTHVWRSELAKTVWFPACTYGEDVAWAAQVSKAARTQVRINEVLYHYHFDERTTETRG